MEDPATDYAGPGAGAPLTRDRLLRLLANERRRQVIARLDEADAPLHVADLACDIARWEADRDPDQAGDHGSKVLETLYHVHLPKLVAVDVLDVGDGLETVAPGPNFDRVTQLEGLLPVSESTESGTN